VNVLKKHIAKSVMFANRTITVMRQRGLEPVFSDWELTQDNGLTVLFGVLDVRRLARIEQYTHPNLLHHLSTICNGTRVLVSNTSGLRYCYVLDYETAIPSSVEFPGIERGIVRLGVDAKGKEVKTAWDGLGHLLVGGQTGMGKSNLLRLLVLHAIAEGAVLYLSDIDGRTFPMLRNHPALGAPIAGTPDEAHQIVARALAEIDKRTLVYNTCGGYPEDLNEYNSLTHDEKLARVLVILDEYNSTAMALGGAKGKSGFCDDVAALSCRGRKFGVHLIIAAQDFEKSVIGKARDQLDALCFRVRSHALTRLVNCPGAVNIPESRKGRAISQRWGVMQTYLIDKADLIGGAPSVLTPAEIEMIRWARSENDGYLPLSEIQTRLGLSQRKARALARDWERRAWLAKDVNASNARQVTEELAKLAIFCTNGQTAQTAQTALEIGQTASGPMDKPPTNRQTVTNERAGELTCADGTYSLL